MKAGLTGASTFFSRGFDNALSIRFEVKLRIVADAVAAGQTLTVLILKRGYAEAQLNRQCFTDVDGGTPQCNWVVSTCMDGVWGNQLIGVPLAATSDWSKVVLEAKFTNDGAVKLTQDGNVLVDRNVALVADAGANEKTSAVVALWAAGGTSTPAQLYADDILVELP